MSTTWGQSHAYSQPGRYPLTATEVRGANLANPLRMLCEEEFERMHLLRNTFDVIETVNTHDDLDALEALFHLLYSVDHFLLFQVLELQNKTTISIQRNSERVRRKTRIERKVMTRTSKNDVGSIPIGNVPTCANRPSNSTPLGIVGRPRIRVQEERKWRA